MESILNRHEAIVLQFSGGKDSIACLRLLQPYLHKILVMWTNAGAPFPETLKQMEAVKAICPLFLEVNGDQPAQIARAGYPVDMLPIRNEVNVQQAMQQKRVPLQSFLGCCVSNIMQPMQEATQRYGATLVIRGQKLSDHQKSPVRSGDIFNGVEYWFPLEDLTDAEVMQMVQNDPLLPDHYDEAMTSLDCWSCTAYLADNQWKLPYLTKHHPEKAAEMRYRLTLIKNEIMAEVNNFEVLNG